MYECRCPQDKKKLAELARPPLGQLNYIYFCLCGQVTPVKTQVESQSHRIVVSLNCPCGLKKEMVIGYLVRIKCRKCGQIIDF